MSDEKPGRAGTGRPRSRREPVTLDQKPLSVTVEPAAAASDAGGSEDTERVAPAAADLPTPATPGPGVESREAFESKEAFEPKAAAADETSLAQPEPGAPEASAAETLVPESPATETPDTGAHGAESAFAASAAGDETPAAEPQTTAPPATEPPYAAAAAPAAPPAPQRRTTGLLLALLAGGIGGAAVSAALPLLLKPAADDQQRFAALEESVGAAASRTEVQAAARAAEEAGSLNAAVATRVSALEERIGQLAERVEAQVEAQAAAGEAGEAPAGADAAEPAAAAADLESLRGEVARIGETLTSSGAELAQVTGRVGAVAERLDGLDQAVTALDPARVREAVEAIPGLSEQLSALRSTVEDKIGPFDIAGIAASADTQAGEIARLATRVTATEGAVAEAERKVVAASTASDERVAVVARLAVLERIGAALSRGAAFPAELDTLSRLGLAATALAPLNAAVGGLPTPPSLAPDFAAAAVTFEAEEVPADAGIVDRLAASASRIVRIRPVDGEPDASDVAGQVEAFLRRGDAAAALAAWQRLPEGARTQTEALAEALRKRIEAQAALGQLTQDQIKALEALPAAPAQGG